MRKVVYRSPAWRHNEGYVAFTEKYDDGSKKTVLEHREVMEAALGRSLESWEHVHHEDENKRNNSLNNLELLTRQEHARRHAYRGGPEMIELACLLCGRSFTRLARHERHNRRQGKPGPYCGRSCAASASMKGNKNPDLTSQLAEDIEHFRFEQ